MKTMGAFAATALLAVLIVTPAYAQQPAGPHDHAQQPAATSPAPSPGPPGGMKGAEMPMMAMCREMMGGTPGMAMGMPGMAMMGPSEAEMDPKQRAAMLEMRGEMMKAMGEVMMKHAHRMHGAPDK